MQVGKSVLILHLAFFLITAHLLTLSDSYNAAMVLAEAENEASMHVVDVGNAPHTVTAERACQSSIHDSEEPFHSTALPRNIS